MLLINSTNSDVISLDNHFRVWTLNPSEPEETSVFKFFIIDWVSLILPKLGCLHRSFLSGLCKSSSFLLPYTTHIFPFTHQNLLLAAGSIAFPACQCHNLVFQNVVGTKLNRSVRLMEALVIFIVSLITCSSILCRIFASFFDFCICEDTIFSPFLLFILSIYHFSIHTLWI